MLRTGLTRADLGWRDRACIAVALFALRLMTNRAATDFYLKLRQGLYAQARGARGD